MFAIAHRYYYAYVLCIVRITASMGDSRGDSMGDSMGDGSIGSIGQWGVLVG